MSAVPTVDAVPAFGASAGAATRPRVAGKFLYSGEDKLWVKGVTYGTFGPGDDGADYPGAAKLRTDFAAMAAAGINAVRVYTVPPRSLLDEAQRQGLYVMIGLPWEQHVAFLDVPRRAGEIEARVRAAARQCAGHPALLGYTVGNEIPPGIVRWHGRRRIERFVRRLYEAAKSEDPAALVTYVNFPTTEYLHLPFLDFACFNVYLESRDRFEAYLARLQNLAGERPLVMAEIGLDSRRQGEAAQAESIDWQVRSAFAEGCAGTFVFSWTDEWHRGGFEIEDWDFGLTTRSRHPKPALAALRRAYAQAPFSDDVQWPRVSVVVCSYNGARTLRDTLDGLARLQYPNFEVIVVNDGSTDATPELAAEYDVRLINTENRGLSSARNTGWRAACGQIVAYIDDDAYPDPHWLHYIAYRFMTGDWVGVGGPNLAPPGDGAIAECVANAPGGPVHVLVSDCEAEHIPGCNMAFRRDALEAVGGFDPRYRAAGDDVDLCWRLQQEGGRIGFHATAMDWHHRRNSVALYWRQQRGYGKAEALLEQKWRSRYSASGHLAWAGRLYGRGFALPIPLGRARVYGGVWGSAAYQALYRPAPATLLALPLMPEWFLVIAALALLSLLALSWPALRIAAPLAVLAATAPLVQAAVAANRAVYAEPAKTTGEKLRRWLVTAGLHVMQPLARLLGRVQHGLTPWRQCGGRPGLIVLPRALERETWSEEWHAPELWLAELESRLHEAHVAVRRGGDYERWDLETRVGTLGAARVRLGIEEHGAGRQMARWRLWPHPSISPTLASMLFAALALGAAVDRGWLASLVLAAVSGLLAWRVAADCGRALAAIERALGTGGRP